LDQASVGFVGDSMQCFRSDEDEVSGRAPHETGIF
jgi:hypothetical protein